MLTLKLFGSKDIRLVETEIPEINDYEILLHTDVAAICGTDIRMWKNGRPGVDETHPLTLGHEFSATIVKVGKRVSTYKIGMRVAMQPNIGCGICDRCVAGNFHLCDEYQAFGINMDGAFAEYVRVPAQAVRHGNLMILTPQISSVMAAIAEPLSCAYNGFSKCFVQAGEKALVVGAGPIGLCHAALLHMAGARVLMSDVQAERLQLGKELFPFIDTYAGDNLAGFVQQWTKNQGLDIAITACPVPQVQSDVVHMMNYGGRINFFGGLPADKEPVGIDTNQVHYKELYLTGSTRSNIAQFRKSLALMQEGLLQMDALVTHRYSLKDAAQAFENAAAAAGLKHIFIFKE